ncbi:unnamed protein product [Urochloa humidicola]
MALGPSTNWAQVKDTDVLEPAIQERESDTSPFMSSPTMARFAVPDPSPVVYKGVPPGIAADEPATSMDDVPAMGIGVVTISPNGTSPRPLVDHPDALLSSPVTWRPAEEILLSVPMDDGPGALTANREIRMVYVRRPRETEQQTPLQLTTPPGTPTTPTTISYFIDKVTKEVDTALPVPNVKQRRRQAYVATELPRRSRRIANLPPEDHNPAAVSVCRELGFTEDNSKVSAATVEKYRVFFKKPLQRNHVKVMATMLGKELPEKLPMQAPSVAIVA